MKAQAGKSPQFDARRQRAPQETAGAFQSCKDVFGTVGPLYRRDVYIRIGQFPVYLYVRNEDELQTRVFDLANQHLRKFLPNTVGNTLQANSSRHDSLYINTCCRLWCRFFYHIAHQFVAYFDIVEVAQSYAAFEAGAHLADIFLLMFEGSHFALEENLAFAQ